MKKKKKKYFSNLRVIDPAGDNFEENKRRFSNCVTRLKKDELFLEKIYIVYLSSNFLYPPFSISTLLSFLPEFLLSIFKDFS